MSHGNPKIQPIGNLARLIEAQVGEAARLLCQSPQVDAWSLHFHASREEFSVVACGTSTPGLTQPVEFDVNPVAAAERVIVRLSPASE